MKWYGFRRRGRWLRLLLIAVLAAGGLVFYLTALAAVHASVTLLGRVFTRSTRRRSVRSLRNAWLVGFLTGLGWLVGLSSALTSLVGSPDAALAVLPFILALALVVGWQVGQWRAAVLLARQPGSLVLGTRRQGVFGVSQPYVLVGVEERCKHVCLFGPTGAGKSTTVESLARQDIANGWGVAIIDPKDQLAWRVAAHIPREREGSVIVRDPLDRQRPVGWNVLQGVPPERRSLHTANLLSVFRRYFGEAAWGHRIEHALRNLILATMSLPNPCLFDIPRLLLEPAFREWVASQVDNPAVVRFLTVEFEEAVRRRGEVLGTLISKIAPWQTFPEVSRLLSVRRGSLDLRQAMDTGAIILAPLAEGSLGEDVAGLLGHLLLTQIQLAAQTRVDLPIEQRRPFVVYLDEAPRFANSSLARLLSEARAFRVAIVACSQHEDQFSPEIRRAILANAGTTIQCSCRRGVYRLYVTRLEDAAAQRPPLVLAPPAPLPPVDPRRVAAIRDLSRARWGRDPAGSAAEALGGDAPGPPAQPAAPPELTPEERGFLVYVSEHPGEPVSRVQQALGLSGSRLTRLRRQLAAKGLLVEVDTRLGKRGTRARFTVPTGQACQILGFEPAGRGGPVHQHLQRLVEAKARLAGYIADAEHRLPDGGSVDVHLERRGVRVAVEISVVAQVGRELRNVEKCLAAGYDQVVCLFLDEAAQTQVQREAQARWPAEASARLRFGRLDELERLLAPVVPGWVSVSGVSEPTLSKGGNSGSGPALPRPAGGKNGPVAPAAPGTDPGLAARRDDRVPCGQGAAGHRQGAKLP